MLYHFWNPIIEPILKSAHVKVIVEIGAEEGKNTRNILNYCKQYDALLHVIDIAPLPSLETWQREYDPWLIFHCGKSLDILPIINHADAILIDGDHNWYTVFHELKVIEAAARHSGRFPIVFVHDTGWPSGRRDSYENPDNIPQEFRHPYEQGGPLPGKDRLAGPDEGAFKPYAFFASREGGKRNGILTAIEDFLKQTDQDLRCVLVPGFHGMGIIASNKLCSQHPPFATFLNILEENPLLSHIQSLENERLDAQAAHRCHDTQRQKLRRVLETNESTLRSKYLKEQWKRGEEAGPLMKRIETLEDTLRHLHDTRSWRWMTPLRVLEEIIRGKRKKQMSSTLANRDIPSEPPPIHNIPIMPMATSDTAVIIPCHNYGRYLDQAIESVLAQILPPREIIVIDDSSDDDTAFVARRYSDKNVRYAFGVWKSVAAARNEGARLTTAPYLIFLDADDYLPPHYLMACKEAMHDPSVGITYGDALHFGKESHFRCAPPFDRERLMRENYISSCAMIRRQAFDMVGGYRDCYGTHQDWDLYRRIFASPWKGKHAGTYFFYRHHEGGMKKKAQRSDRWGYVRRAMLLHHPLTIFTPFAGRKEIFPEFLETIKSIDLDPSILRIHWHDTSGDHDFGQMLRDALAALPYERTTYTAAPLPQHWPETPASLMTKRPRHQDDSAYYTQIVVSRAYNSFIMSCDTEFALTLEDDILMAPDTIRKLLEVFEENVVTVIAPYYSRFGARTIIRTIDTHGRETPVQSIRSGVEEVAGGGFGCTLLRMSALRGEPIYATGDAKGMWYDHRVFKRLRSKGKVLCHWDAFVEHRGAMHPTPVTKEPSHTVSVHSP